jgi:molybdenum-dependent DNA-binding transcriptional regulator ModE
MFTSEGRAPVTEIQDRLIELYVQQDEARRADDRDRARELQVEIDKAAAQREEIRPLKCSGPP